jgi:hypothetical protein
MDNSNPNSTSRISLKYLITGAFILTLLVTLVASFFSFAKESALVTVTAIMAGVLILVEVLPRVADFRIGPVKATLNKVEKDQQLLKAEIQAIRVSLALILTTFESDYLRKMANGGKWCCRYDPDTYNRLKRLDDLGFVLPKVIEGERKLVRIQELFGDERIEVDKRKWFNMNDFVEITEAGKTYLKLLDEVTRRAPASPSSSSASI